MIETVNYDFLRRRAPQLTDLLLTDLVIDIRTNAHNLSEEQVVAVKIEDLRRGAESDAAAGYQFDQGNTYA